MCASKKICLLLIVLLNSILFLLPTAGISETQKERSQIVSEIKIDNLRGTIDRLEKYGERSSWEKQDRAISWAVEEFRKLGIDAWTESYKSDGKVWRNCFAKIKGKSNPSTLIMLTAHIDSISRVGGAAPGADDNGSGLAVLFECARLLLKTPLNKSVQFCIFTNEERGQKGSKAFTRKAREKGQNINSVINVDVLGYNKIIAPTFWQSLFGNNSFRNRAKIVLRAFQNCFSRASVGRDAILIAGRPANANLVKIAGDKMRQVVGITVKERVGNECGCGDEGSFWNEGYNAIYINSLYENPYHHTAWDRIENIDFIFLEKATKGILATITYLANREP